MEKCVTNWNLWMSYSELFICYLIVLKNCGSFAFISWTDMYFNSDCTVYHLWLFMHSFHLNLLTWYDNSEADIENGSLQIWKCLNGAHVLDNHEDGFLLELGSSEWHGVNCSAVIDVCRSFFSWCWCYHRVNLRLMIFNQAKCIGRVAHSNRLCLCTDWFTAFICLSRFFLYFFYKNANAKNNLRCLKLQCRD